ncbi:MAG: prenyltransferase [Gammaproteobacteria bacterium]|nr:prenyltransferase [Gammaproteobacteria bacterium]
MITTIIKTMRPAFLIFGFVCVLLAVASVHYIVPDITTLFLITLGAITAHISVNMLNEYHDFKSRLDFNTSRTPFSGGSGALPQNPQYENAVFITALMAVAITIVIGIYFLFEVGAILLIPGLLGIAIIITYTPIINRHPWLCLVAPGAGFGLIMINMIAWILSNNLSLQTLLYSLIIFFLANNLLLLNQIPDIEADIKAGRKHLPAYYGINISRLFFAINITMAALIIVISSLLVPMIPTASLLALLPLALSIFSLRALINFGADIAKRPQYLAMNVVSVLLTPLALSIGELLS